MYGVTLQHALSENTFYDVHLTYIRSNNDARFNEGIPSRIGGDTIVLWFADTVGMARWARANAVDNLPYGWADPAHEEIYITDEGGAEFGISHQCGMWNTSWSESYVGSLDFSSQINKYNLVKIGLSFQYDRMHEFVITQEGWFWHLPTDNPETDRYRGYYLTFDGTPILAGLYLQDKIEFEGMFANFGLRLDYSDPNVAWINFEDDPYSDFLSYLSKDSLFTQAPLEDVSPILKLSPRIGISFPVLEKSKLFFNYGHFYALPSNSDRYRIDWGQRSQNVHFIGNPRLAMARTIAYEVGLESSIADMFMARISGYYKDIDNETDDVRYYGVDFGGFCDYQKPENINYGDTRGFEFEFRKDHGSFFTGWVNYNYMVESEGRIGPETYYQDPASALTELEVDPFEDRPIPRPVLRAQITLKAPLDWGMFLGGYNLSFLYSRRAGHTETWNPYGEEYEDILENNLQWAPTSFVDMSVSKDFSFAGVKANLFFDMHNIFDWQTLSTQAFEPANGVDRTQYLKSLHLEMYNEEPWLSDPDVTGPAEGEAPDQIGEMRSEDKPYINNPNREFLYYLNPRYAQFGIRVSF
jgi:hypothetical protein